MTPWPCTFSFACTKALESSEHPIQVRKDMVYVKLGS